MKRINIAIASPSDVQPERDAVLRIFTRWNEDNDPITLHPVMWESASVPTLGAHPQQILNQKIIEKSELLVAILWSRLGTPTPTAPSGTVEEIQEFISEKGPGRVMLYFCKRNLPHDIDPAELARLQNFKKEMKLKGLLAEYETVSEFEGLLYRHLDHKVEELNRGELPLPPKEKIKSAAEQNAKKHGDQRLNQLLDFGTKLPDIARNFALRMDEFDAIDGVDGTKKFYDLGAHVYSSVAASLDQALAYAHISSQSRGLLEGVSVKLKRLAANLPDKNDDFRDYWAAGRRISNEISAHVSHAEKWER